jgi:hypothetical protein
MENKFICQYCGKDTSQVEYDYLSGYNHLSCALENEIKSNEYDVCVMCGKQSPYKRSTHIDLRVGYVEGAGQGCFEPHMCSQERSRSLLTISEELVYSTPNDQELGEKVRQIYWEYKNSLK